MARIDEVAPGIHRISYFDPGAPTPITFNQFLIAGEHPALIHTGHFQRHAEVRRALAQVLDPTRLRYVVAGHFEADECGAMAPLLAEAPGLTLVCSEVGSSIALRGWDYGGRVQAVRDGDVIDLGGHRLRFLETPHVHHWDSLMTVEETTGSLFSSDLFIQAGEQPPVVRADLSRDMCRLYRELGLFAAEAPVRRVVDRLPAMGLRWIHPMHGGSLPDEAAEPYFRALREEAFAFDGRLRGRMLPL